MAKGTNFGGVHSYTDLNLIQQKVEIQPAEPKLNLVDIPGADGSKDLSELPAGRVVYKDRILTWIFALYPGEDWHAKHRQVSNELNGKQCKITLDDDPGWYYKGRLTVKKYNTDRLLRQITIEATCSPYLLKQNPTVITTDLTTTLQRIVLPNEKMLAVPTIEVTAETVVRWAGVDLTISAGSSYRNTFIELQRGPNLMEAKTLSGTGTITVTYQEGSL